MMLDNMILDNMMSDEMRDELDAFFETIIVDSEIFKRRSYEAACRFALEQRVPLEDEYFELIRSISDEVVENDDEVNEIMTQRLTAMVFEDERLFKAMFLEYAKEKTEKAEADLN